VRWADAAGRLLAVLPLCAAAFAQASHAEPAPDSDAWSYRVARGDTLIAVSAEYLARPNDWPRLQRLNRVADPRRLRPGSLLRIPLSWMRETATVAEVAFVQGRATVAGLGFAVDQSARLLAIGDMVRAHDIISTDDDASVTLRFADGSRLLIGPASEVGVVHLLEHGKSAVPDVRLKLDRGNTEVHVEPARAGRRFEIQTPAINLGVRGTEFRARVDPAGRATRLEVLEGRVTAASGSDQVFVESGLGTVTELGRPAGPLRRLVDAPDLTGILERLERVPLKFAWRGLAGAQGYHAQVFPQADAEQLLLDGTSTDALVKWPDLPDGSYLLRVRALDLHGLEGLNATVGFVLKARPEPPFTTSPAEGSTSHGNRVAFSWARVPAASRYRLQVSASPDFAALVFDDDHSAQQDRIVALEPGHYYWRVASIAIAADGQDDAGPFGDPQSFTQRALPPSPAVEPPQPSPRGVLLRWKTPESGQKVRFQVATDRAFNNIVLDETTQESAGLLPAPAPGVYFVRVKTIDADGFEGDFGAFQQVEVPRSKWWLLIPLGLLLLGL
jgi:hypothetical protein